MSRADTGRLTCAFGGAGGSHGVWGYGGPDEDAGDLLGLDQIEFTLQVPAARFGLRASGLTTYVQAGPGTKDEVHVGMIHEHDGSRGTVMKLLWILQPYRSVKIWAAEWRMTLDQVESTSHVTFLRRGPPFFEKSVYMDLNTGTHCCTTDIQLRLH